MYTDLFARYCASGCEIQAHTSGCCAWESDPSGSAHRESAHSWAVGYVSGGQGRNRNGRAIWGSAMVAKFATATFLTTRVRDKKCYKKVEPTAWKSWTDSLKKLSVLLVISLIFSNLEVPNNKYYIMITESKVTRVFSLMFRKTSFKTPEILIKTRA